MALSNSSSPRTPLWGKSMARFLGGTKPKDDGTPPKSEPSGNAGDPKALEIDDRVLTHLGLKKPPTDPKLLTEFLVAEDKADAEIDADGFARGIRRAVRLNLALAAGLHRRAGMPWKEWVERTFQVGYACFNRYHVAAEIQFGLIARGLPPLVNENQSRSIASLRKHEKIWDALGSDTYKGGFPTGKELKSQLRETLGIKQAEERTSPRIKLHRNLWKIQAATLPGDDPAMVEALTLIRRAVAVLEKGSTP